MEKKQNSSLGLLLTMQRWSWGEGGCQLLSTAALIFLSRLHLLNPTSTSNNLVMKKTDRQPVPSEKQFQRSSCWIFRVLTIHRRRSCQTDDQPNTLIIRDRRKWIFTSVRDFLHKSREEEKEGDSFDIFCCSFITLNSLLACSIILNTLPDIEHKSLMNVILKCEEGRTKTKTLSKKTNFAHKIFTQVEKKRMRESDFNKCWSIMSLFFSSVPCFWTEHLKKEFYEHKPSTNSFLQRTRNSNQLTYSQTLCWKAEKKREGGPACNKCCSLLSPHSLLGVPC